MSVADQDLDRPTRQMQQALLPGAERMDALRREAGLRIFAHFQPLGTVGGDLWSLQRLGEGCAALSVVDFSGHDLAAARNTFCLHAMMQGAASPDPVDPAAYLERLNDGLVKVLPTGQFATMFLAVIDTRAGRLRYSAAGAPSPVVVSDRPYFLDGSGLPLGISPGARYDNLEIPFPQGSDLLLYSDALVESADDQGRCWPADDLLATVERCRHLSPDPLRHLIGRFLAERTGLDDDLTAVWVHREF